MSQQQRSPFNKDENAIIHYLMTHRGRPMMFDVMAATGLTDEQVESCIAEINRKAGKVAIHVPPKGSLQQIKQPQRGAETVRLLQIAEGLVSELRACGLTKQDISALLRAAAKWNKAYAARDAKREER